MGFLEGLGRFMAGKPVFQDSTSPQAPTENTASPHEQPQATDQFGTPVDASGHKIIPEVEIEEIRSHRHEHELEVTAWITNRSEVAIRIDYCNLINQRQTLDYELAPGKAHELVLYKGPVPMTDSYHRAEVVFRIMPHGEQFDHVYYVSYHREEDGAYLVDEFHNDGPIRDFQA